MTTPQIGNAEDEDVTEGTFEKISAEVFAIRPGASSSFLDLQVLTAENVESLLCRGYCIQDGLVAAKLASSITDCALKSFARSSWGCQPGSGANTTDTDRCLSVQEDVEGVNLDFRWRIPDPRWARGDFIAEISKSDSAAAQDPIKILLETFQFLAEDLATIAVLTGDSEMQLAYYTAGSGGYRRHMDAASSGTTAKRIFTAIFYCSGDTWLPEDGGSLQIWLPRQIRSSVSSSCADVDWREGTTLRIDPIAGRLVLFLSGCVPHEVLPNFADRVAFTMWLR